MLLMERGSSNALQCAGGTASLRALCWKGVGCFVHTREQKIPAELLALLFRIPVDVVIVPPQAGCSFSC